MALPVNGSTHLIPAYYSFYRPRKDERLSWPSWLTCSGWLTHISGHPSAAGRAQDRESSPVRDRRSTTVPRHQPTVVVGNVGNNSVSSYRLHASETQQLPYVPMAVDDVTPICYWCGVARGSRRPVTGRLATHPSNAMVETGIVSHTTVSLQTTSVACLTAVCSNADP